MELLLFQFFAFQFARAAANHFLCENLRNPLSESTVTTVAYRYFPSAKRRSTVLLGNFFVCSLDMSGEFH